MLKGKKKGCLTVALILRAITLFGIGGSSAVAGELANEVSESIEEEKKAVKAKVMAYKFTELAREDISYKSTPRLVVRIRLDTDDKPTKERMIKTANQLWSQETKPWKEFTVFIIYGEMENFNYGAYGAAELRPKGLLEFKTYEDNYKLWEM